MCGPGKSLMGLCFLILLVTTFASPSSAAGASGSVSLSIRLEVGIAGLQGGESSSYSQPKSGAVGVLSELAPRLRDSLRDRYQPSEVERIVTDVTEHAVIVIDGEAFAHNPSGDTWLISEHGSVLSL